MPTDSDWRLSHSRSYENPKKVKFPNGNTIEASFVFFEPNFDPVTKIVTQNKVVLGINEDYTTYVIDGAEAPKYCKRQFHRPYP